MLNLLLIVGSTYPDAETLEMGEQYDAAEIHRRKVDQNRGCISVLSFGPFHSWGEANECLYHHVCICMTFPSEDDEIWAECHHSVFAGRAANDNWFQ